MKREKMVSHDGKEVMLCLWDEVDAPKASIVIVHGMSEHIERYDEFATFLNGHGYIVCGFDNRAHGKTDPDNLGIAYGNLFEDTVEDIAKEVALVKERYKLPVGLIGHSYGSFLSQRFLQKHSDELVCAVLSGSALQEGIIVSVGHALAKSKCKKHAKEAGRTFEKLTFEQYAKKVGGGENCWLSYNQESIDEYNANPITGFTCSNGFYESFFAGLKRIKKEAKPFENPLPLLLVAGKEDGVGGYGKLVTKLHQRYKKLNLNPEIILYEKMRHEILNEPEREKVYNDILAFEEKAFANAQ